MPVSYTHLENEVCVCVCVCVGRLLSIFRVTLTKQMYGGNVVCRRLIDGEEIEYTLGRHELYGHIISEYNTMFKKYFKYFKN